MTRIFLRDWLAFNGSIEHYQSSIQGIYTLKRCYGAQIYEDMDSTGESIGGSMPNDNEFVHVLVYRVSVRAKIRV